MRQDINYGLRGRNVLGLLKYAIMKKKTGIWAFVIGILYLLLWLFLFYDNIGFLIIGITLLMQSMIFKLSDDIDEIKNKLS